MKTALFIKIAYYSETTLEERVASDISKVSFQSEYLMKYSRVCMENLENTQELSRQSLLTEKNIISQKWRNW